MRSLAVFFGVLAIVLAFSIPVHAQGAGYGMGPGMMYGYGPGYGYGMGPGMMGGYGGYGMGPGMMYGYGPGYGSHPQSQACQRFLNDTKELRKELMNKRFEYFEATRSPKTTSEDLAVIEKELDALQEKIHARNTRGCWW